MPIWWIQDFIKATKLMYVWLLPNLLFPSHHFSTNRQGSCLLPPKKYEIYHMIWCIPVYFGSKPAAVPSPFSLPTLNLLCIKCFCQCRAGPWSVPSKYITISDSGQERISLTNDAVTSTSNKITNKWVRFNGTSTQFRSLLPTLTRKADTESPTVKESRRYINLHKFRVALLLCRLSIQLRPLRDKSGGKTYL